ncbi:type II toxin-antitoxin system RelE/ParE family toxin [Limnobaculum eriocheiris]|uniref:type II toxin-antitoxin system RelE/ParE family toxin n=1 Tax=Limnobaculum eriocheiris TaxID=2897391 RepID=UPI003B8455D3
MRSANHLKVRFIQQSPQAPTVLVSNPHIGEQLFQFEPREIRKILVGEYEVRYEIINSNIYILRIWHTRESR